MDRDIEALSRAVDKALASRAGRKLSQEVKIQILLATAARLALVQCLPLACTGVTQFARHVERATQGMALSLGAYGQAAAAGVHQEDN